LPKRRRGFGLLHTPGTPELLFLRLTFVSPGATRRVPRSPRRGNASPPQAPRACRRDAVAEIFRKRRALRVTTHAYARGFDIFAGDAVNIHQQNTEVDWNFAGRITLLVDTEPDISVPPALQLQSIGAGNFTTCAHFAVLRATVC
jgi:hypothetical protein